MEVLQLYKLLQKPYIVTSSLVNTTVVTRIGSEFIETFGIYLFYLFIDLPWTTHIY